MGRHRDTDSGRRATPRGADPEPLSGTDADAERDDRLAETAEILARGYLRLTARQGEAGQLAAQTADPAQPGELSESAGNSLASGPETWTDVTDSALGGHGEHHRRRAS